LRYILSGFENIDLQLAIWKVDIRFLPFGAHGYFRLLDWAAVCCCLSYSFEGAATSFHKNVQQEPAGGAICPYTRTYNEKNKGE
jgi:hypothetical protein